MFAEHRTLAYLLEDINKQRQAAGASTVVLPGQQAPGNPATSGLQPYGNRTSSAGVSANAAGTFTAPTSQPLAAQAAAARPSFQVPNQGQAAVQRLAQTGNYFAQNPDVLANENTKVNDYNTNQAAIDQNAGVQTDRTFKPMQDVFGQAVSGAIGAQKTPATPQYGQPGTQNFGTNPQIAGNPYTPQPNQATSPSGNQPNGQPAGQSTTNQPPNQSTQQGSQPAAPIVDTSGIQAAVGSLPPQYQYLGPILQSYLQNASSGIQAQQGLAGIIGNKADALYQNQSNALQTFGSQLQKSNDQMQGILNTVKDTELQHLADQQKSQDDQLAWSQMQQTRNLHLDEQKAIDSNIAQIAMDGGFGSPDNSGSLNKVQALYENQIADLAAQTQFKRTDLAIDFNHQYSQVSNQYKSDSLNNLKSFQSELEKLSFQDLSNQGARFQAETSALTNMVNNQQKIRDDATAGISGITGKIMDAQTNLVRIQFDKQQNVMQHLQDVWSKTLPVGGKPSQAVLDAAKAAEAVGVDPALTAPFKTGESPIASIMPMYNMMGQQAANPNNYTPEQQPLVNMLSNINAGADANKQHSDAITLSNLLKSGDKNAINNFLVSAAKSKLSGDDQKLVSGGSDAVNQISRVQDFISGHMDELKNQNIVKFNVENLKKFALQSKDPAYQAFAQDLGFLNADVLHTVYGSRLTETEIGFATQFLPQIQNDTLKNVVGKLDGMKQHYQSSIDNTLERQFGTGNTYQGTALPTEKSTTPTPSAPIDWSDPNAAASNLMQQYYQ